MEAGLDNSNNPFGMPNGANNTDNILSQKSDGLLLNLTDNFKQNGTDLQATDFFSNGKRLESDFDDEDFGPETDVDALDDVLSPGPKQSGTKNFSDAFSTSPNNNLLAEEGVYNPFMEHQEKAAMESGNFRKRETREEFDDEERMAREETPTPPADTVHDVSGLVENPADSESEDEWDYFKGDEANKENLSPQPGKEVAHIPEEDDTMSQLNPNAAEFVPVSPTRSVPSPTCRMLINDQIVSQSPKKANDVDISVPNLKDFENEVKSRPSEIDANGHADPSDLDTEIMENILNGKNIDEIPEFQPGSTPKKFTSDEFHFGPHAAPFTPKRLDQSEALSTQAVYGDDTLAAFDGSFNESLSQDLNILNKESDPMSMSFYADKGDTNPFDLNKVQVLPDNLDDFLNKPDNEAFNETISDLPEHNPLEDVTNVLNNDDAIKLNKQCYDYEKELASPTEETDFSKTPEPTFGNSIRELHCGIKTENTPVMPEDVELISPNPSPLPDATEVSNLLTKEAAEAGDVLYKEATEVEDLLNTGETEVNNLHKEVIEASDILNRETNDNKILLEEGASDDLRSDTPDYMKEATEVSDLLKTDTEYLKEVTENIDFASKNTKDTEFLNEHFESAQPKLEEFARLETYNTEYALSDNSEFERSPSETEKDELKELIMSPTPVCRLPLEDFKTLEEVTSTVCDIPKDDFEQNSVSPLPPQVDVTISEKSEKLELEATPEPIPEHFKLEYPEGDSKSSVCDLPESKSPMPEAPVTPNFTNEELLEEAQERFEELCKPIETPEEDVTSSTNDDLLSPVQDPLNKSPIEDPAIEEEAVNKEDNNVLSSELNTVTNEALSFENAALDSLSRVKSPLNFCSYPPEDHEKVPIDVKTETISPEFAEPTVVTPSEESKDEDLNIAATAESIQQQIIDDFIKVPPTEELVNKEEHAKELLKEPQTEEKVEQPQIIEPVKEPQPEEQKVEHLENEMTAVGVAAIVAAGAAITAVVSTTKVEDKKKSPSVSSSKKTTTTKTITNKSPAPISKTSPRLGVSAPKQTTSKTTTTLRATTPKTGTTKPPTSATSAPKPSPRTNLLKPKTSSSTVPKTTSLKPTEKSSSLTNGEVKTTARSNLGVKKTVSEVNGAKTATSRPATATTLSKVSQSRLTTKPNPTAPSKTTIPPRSAPLAPKVPSATAKRPTTLTSKSGPTSPDKITSTVKTTLLSKTSPKSTTNIPPKPKPATNAISKPRIPATRTVTKAQPDTEKQIKESANKITASRTISSARSVGSTNMKTAFSSTRKIENKVSSTRTTATKTTTTTMKSTTAKKPIEIIRGPVKTKTTKIEKPKENGVSAVVTEEITIVSSTNAVIETSQHEPELIKDNSPVDNKLLIETTQLVETNAD